MHKFLTKMHIFLPIWHKVLKKMHDFILRNLGCDRIHDTLQYSKQQPQQQLKVQQQHQQTQQQQQQQLRLKDQKQLHQQQQQQHVPSSTQQQLKPHQYRHQQPQQQRSKRPRQELQQHRQQQFNKHHHEQQHPQQQKQHHPVGVQNEPDVQASVNSTRVIDNIKKNPREGYISSESRVTKEENLTDKPASNPSNVLMAPLEAPTKEEATSWDPGKG